MLREERGLGLARRAGERGGTSSFPPFFFLAEMFLP